MLGNIRGLNSWRHKECRAIYKTWRQRIVKQDESNGDLEFIMTIGFGGKSSSRWKTNKRQYWKCRGVCRAFRNPILESNVGQTNFENIRNGMKSFLPQEMVWHEVWTRGFQKRHTYIWWSPRKMM